MTVILIHKATNLRSIATATGNFPPKEVLKACIMDMANRLGSHGVDIRTAKHEDFMIVDTHGQGYKQQESSQNVHNFSFHFG